jgi:hypothetical protein
MKIRIYILFFLFACSLWGESKSDDFDQLSRLFRQQCRFAGLSVKNNIKFYYNSKRSLLANVDKYAELVLQYYLKNREVTWLKSGLVYNCYTRWPNSGFWKSIGYGYQAIKINDRHGLFPTVDEILTQKVLPKYEALYFLHGQYASMLIKVLNRVEGVSVESCNDYIVQGFADDWLEAISLSYPQKEVDYSNLDEWFRSEALVCGNSPMAEMPVGYVRDMFESLFLVKWTKILATDEVKCEELAMGKVLKIFDKRVLIELGKVYYAKAFRLWLESPVVIRPQIELLLKAFSAMKKGNIEETSRLLLDSRRDFASRCRLAVSISKWLDEAELATIPADERFRVYQKVLKTAPNSKYSQYLDQIEQDLERLKE